MQTVLYIIGAAAAVAVLLAVIIYLIFSAMHSAAFGKRPVQNEESSSYTYEHYKESLTRKEVTFKGTCAELHAFIYGEENSKALIVFAHGIGGQHEEYMSSIAWFVKNGYRVFAVDFSGSGKSGGKGTISLAQSAIDLDSAMTYIEADSELNKLPKVLFGHSWGAHGVASALNYGHDVKATVCVAGYNCPVDQLAFSLGKIGAFLKPYMKAYYRLNYGKKGAYTAVSGINKANTPVLLVQGEKDPINTPTGTGIYAYRSKITNPKVEYMYITKPHCASHSSPFYVDEANYIMSELEALYFEYSGKDKNEEFERRVNEYKQKFDKELFSRPNEEFLSQVDAFFVKSIA